MQHLCYVGRTKGPMQQQAGKGTGRSGHEGALGASPRRSKCQQPDKQARLRLSKDRYMKIMIDGMDQAKFCLPRNKKLAATSDASKHWKPALHVTGVITWGLQELYFLLPSSVPKDSNTNRPFWLVAWTWHRSRWRRASRCRNIS